MPRYSLVLKTPVSINLRESKSKASTSILTTYSMANVGTLYFFHLSHKDVWASEVGVKCYTLRWTIHHGAGNPMLARHIPLVEGDGAII